MSLAVHIASRADAKRFAMTNHALVVAVSVLMVSPCAVFALSLKPVPALAILAGCAMALGLIATRRSAEAGDILQAQIDISRLILAIGAALGILILGGETHLVFTTSDWLIRDAVLSDLSTHGFPVGYQIGAGVDLLRAPLGMYMLPALVGRGFGLLGAHRAMLAQNAAILGTIFYLLMALGRGWPHLLVLIGFAGLSLVGSFERVESLHEPGVPFWLQHGLDSWHPFFQYSGSLVQFFWVPNHALPGWWLATLILLQRRAAVDVATIGVTVAAASFWSPLVVIPLVPWLLYCAARDWRSVLLSRRTWLGVSAACGFLPILVYMLLATSSISHESAGHYKDFAFWYGFFVIVQLPALLFVLVAWRRIPREFRAPLIIGGLVLLVLPFYHFGPNNDLVMRASIPPLVILAFVFGWVLIDLTAKRRIAAIVGWLLFAAGLPSAAVEIGRAISTPRTAISDCSLMQASVASGDVGLPSNYIAPVSAVPFWLMRTQGIPLAPVADHACWPDLESPRFFAYRVTTTSLTDRPRPPGALRSLDAVQDKARPSPAHQ